MGVEPTTTALARSGQETASEISKDVVELSRDRCADGCTSDAEGVFGNYLTLDEIVIQLRKLPLDMRAKIAAEILRDAEH